MYVFNVLPVFVPLRHTELVPDALGQLLYILIHF